MRVPHRRHGRPVRSYTQWSSPRRSEPVVLCSHRSRPQQPARRADQAGQVGDVPDAGPRRHPAQEEHLAPVEVAEPGQPALVEQREPDLVVGGGLQPEHRLVGVEGLGEHVGTEVPDHARLLGGREHVDDRQPVADRLPVGVLQHDAHLPGRAARPAVARPVQVPAAVHPEVRVQGEAAGQPGQHVLAARHHLAHRLPGQVERRELRYAEVGAHQRPAGERLVHPVRGQPDGVALRHRAGAPGRKRRRTRWCRPGSCTSRSSGRCPAAALDGAPAGRATRRATRGRRRSPA